MSVMIEADALRKRYGDTQALDGVSFAAPAGTILGVLGPNGAGKSTSVKILTTFADADAGTARVGGYDVRADRHAVRSIIGVTAQDTTLDGLLTGRQNLEMMGELCGLSRADAKRRATELLERFELSDAADRMVKGYSGGMRRRLDLAASIVHRPPVLFLDEPTTGLDPTSRMRMWDLLRELVRDGLTLLLTTQYLDEADQLADNIVVIDHGRVIAEGTPSELKRATGGLVLRLHLREGFDAARQVVASFASGPVELSAGQVLQAPVAAEPGLATRLVRALDTAGVVVDDIELHRPSLDDVFFALTGERSESTADDVEAELVSTGEAR